MPNTPPARRIITIGFAGMAAAALSCALVDRPLARWIHDNLAHQPLFPWLTHIVDPVVPLALGILLIAGLAAAFGKDPRPGMRPLLALAVAVLVAVAVKDELKWMFGRSWPETWVNGNPSYIRDGVFTFAWFHGGRGWASFPSGHMTLITAAVAALWRESRGLRWIGAVVVILVAVGLLGADYHWLSDIIAGTLLGAAVGLGVAGLVNRQPA